MQLGRRTRKLHVRRTPLMRLRARSACHCPQYSRGPGLARALKPPTEAGTASASQPAVCRAMRCCRQVPLKYANHVTGASYIISFGVGSALITVAVLAAVNLVHVLRYQCVSSLTTYATHDHRWPRHISTDNLRHAVIHLQTDDQMIVAHDFHPNWRL